MTAAPRPWARRMLRVWFHDLDSSDWFGGSDAVDAMLARNFARDLDRLEARPAAEFVAMPDTARAAILLFDQVSRNIHRGTPDAFASDTLARSITYEVIDRGWLDQFERNEKQFVLMPLMHSEDIADQRLSLAMFARHCPGALGFARSHWRMIARFGRFPHRNEILGRRTTPAEQRAIERGFSW